MTNSTFFQKLKELWNRLISAVVSNFRRVSSTALETGTKSEATPANVSLKPKWLLIAEGEIGVKEVYGGEHNPRILEYGRAVTDSYSEDEIPWCAYFVNWVLLMSDIQGTGSGLARSFLDWGYHLKDPRIGCVCVFRRGSSTWQGHVGFYAGGDDTYVYLLGGNQSNEVSISKYRKSKLLGYRWPTRPNAEEA